MYHWRVFLWKNGGKSTEYTPYVVAPIFLEDRLDETLDSGEIILKSMPISTRGAFPPKTKFRIERYTTADYSDTPRKWDMLVEHDDVEEYAGCPEICTHRVNLIEASVVAQGMHVDNIALTYELQDVDLNYRTVVTDNTVIGEAFDDWYKTDNTHAKDDTINVISNNTSTTLMMYHRTGNFINAYKYEWDKNSLGSIGNIVRHRNAENSEHISFTIPKLFIYGSESNNSWNSTPLYQLNTITRVYKRLFLNGTEISKTTILTVRSGAKSFNKINNSYGYCDGENAYIRKIKTFSSQSLNNMYGSFEPLYEYDSASPIARANSSFAETVSFDTDVLSRDELEAGYTLRYTIECKADETYQNGMISYYSASYYFYYFQMAVPMNGGYIWGDPDCTAYCTDGSKIQQANDIKVSAHFDCYDLTEGHNTPFTSKGVKYSCYDLIRKALMTCDTYVINNDTTSLDEYGIESEDSGELVAVKSIEYPIIIDNNPLNDWVSRLKTAKMQETIFECKNFWEVCLQSGYYIHAIPRLDFAQDGTDRFSLSYRQLGDTKMKQDSSVKITVFNSRNLSDFFTQYDSYVTNLFSPQNLVEEWVSPKTSDPSYLVSNDTAELQLKYPITEIVEFDIVYNGIAKSALPFIFEQAVYEILSNADPSQISPAKGNSIYYTLGKNKIEGLSYVAPSANNDKLMALKYIMQKLFGVNPSVWTQTYTFNNLRFRVKYRTQDDLRLTQFRPDLQNFFKNSSYEKYPHHEQYYGQQDKIIDSERFSANLFGKLVRVGNAVYQRQEYAVSGNEKESGDLVSINGEVYYVTATENEYYADAILQKVTYSKNFNQLSNIVTIPSEPRFYEVSERSKIRREVRMQEFFALSTEPPTENNSTLFLKNEKWVEFLKSLIFFKNRTLPNFAWMRFMADKKRKHRGENGGFMKSSVLFPSSDFVKTGANTLTPLAPSDHSDCIVPVLHFPLHDGIVFEWDMEDNFKVGDYIDNKISSKSSTVDKAYMAQQSHRYVDIMGRADLFRFALFFKNNWTDEQIQKLPQAVIDMPADSVIAVQGDKSNAVALDKDNREEISFNYQINLLHRASEGDDDFITFPNLFGEKDSDLKVCLINQTQSMFNENVSLTADTILADNVSYYFTSTNKTITINFGNPAYRGNANITQVKSIVFYHENSSGGRTAFIVKNVARLPDSDKLIPWYIFPVFNN